MFSSIIHFFYRSPMKNILPVFCCTLTYRQSQAGQLATTIFLLVPASTCNCKPAKATFMCMLLMLVPSARAWGTGVWCHAIMFLCTCFLVEGNDIIFKCFLAHHDSGIFCTCPWLIMESYQILPTWWENFFNHFKATKGMWTTSFPSAK